MKKTLAILALMPLAWAIGCSSMNQHDTDEEKETVIQFDRAPAAVQTSAKNLAGDAKIEQVSKENEDGRDEYEVKFTRDGRSHSATILADGTVDEDEAVVPANEVPAAVVDAVHQKYPNTPIQKAELVKAKGNSLYEIHVKVNGDGHELQITPDGTVKSDKTRHKHDEEKEEKDDRD